MSASADTAGFREAMNRLVQNLGTDVVFKFPVSNGYASGVYVDPEMGTPLDPTLTPSASSASADVTVRATVFRGVPNSQNEGENNSGGIYPQGSLWLRIPDGYDQSILSADKVLVNSELFRVERFVEDGLDTVDRLYVECELIDDDYV